MIKREPIEPVNLTGILTFEEREDRRKLIELEFENEMHRIMDRDMPPINSHRGVEYYSGEFYG